jgi:CrcB protein
MAALESSTALQVVSVGAGGFVGSICRWALSGLVQRAFPAAAFPWGTLAVNVLGCLAIGALAALGETRQLFGPEARAFLFFGLLGGFTTFSTFGWEVVALARDGQHGPALLNVLSHLVLGFLAVWAGYALAAR